MDKHSAADEAAFILNTCSPYIRVAGVSLNAMGFFSLVVVFAYFLLLRPTSTLMLFIGAVLCAGAVYIILAPSINAFFKKIWDSSVSRSLMKTRIKIERERNENNFYK